MIKCRSGGNWVQGKCWEKEKLENCYFVEDFWTNEGEKLLKFVI